MANKETIGRTVTVTVLLCIVCSVVVSLAAVFLRPIQEVNKTLNFKSNVLSVAGLLNADAENNIQVLFDERVTIKLIDIDSGQFSEKADVELYDQKAASKDFSLSDALESADDIAKISRREQLGLVYMINSDKGLETLVLPIRGYGLWSTLYGFIALDADLNTVKGLVFYDQKETPGLGGEVDNPKWKALWRGKKVYGQNGQVALEVIKGSVNASSSNAAYEVDGLSGATLTSKGVTNLVHFWMSEKGYKPFLTKLKKGEA